LLTRVLLAAFLLADGVAGMSVMTLV